MYSGRTARPGGSSGDDSDENNPPSECDDAGAMSASGAAGAAYGDASQEKDNLKFRKESNTMMSANITDEHQQVLFNNSKEIVEIIFKEMYPTVEMLNLFSEYGIPRDLAKYEDAWPYMLISEGDYYAMISILRILVPSVVFTKGGRRKHNNGRTFDVCFVHHKEDRGVALYTMKKIEDLPGGELTCVCVPYIPRLYHFLMHKLLSRSTVNKYCVVMSKHMVGLDPNDFQNLIAPMQFRPPCEEQNPGNLNESEKEVVHNPSLTILLTDMPVNEFKESALYNPEEKSSINIYDLNKKSVIKLITFDLKFCKTENHSDYGYKSGPVENIEIRDEEPIHPDDHEAGPTENKENREEGPTLGEKGPKSREIDTNQEASYRYQLSGQDNEDFYAAVRQLKELDKENEIRKICICKEMERKYMTKKRTCRLLFQQPHIAVHLKKGSQFNTPDFTKHGRFDICYYQPNEEAEYAIKSQDITRIPLSREEVSNLRKTVQKHRTSLMSGHTNLNMISFSPVKCTSGKLKNQKCIVLYCDKKGILPLGEKSFPVELKDAMSDEMIPVDVREAHLMVHMDNGLDPKSAYLQRLGQCLEELVMGCSIGNYRCKAAGSLGVFVRCKDSPSKIGFLTCKHVIQSNTKFMVHPSFKDSPENSRIVGMVERMQEMQNDGPGDIAGNQGQRIDAAFVVLNDDMRPKSYRLNCSKNELECAGLPKNLTFNQMLPGEVLEGEPLFKCGRTTTLTKGSLSSEPFISDGFSEYIQIEPFSFSDRGDSGSLVFQMNEVNQPVAVGVMWGGASHGTTFATPIQPILSSLNVEIATLQAPANMQYIYPFPQVWQEMNS